MHLISCSQHITIDELAWSPFPVGRPSPRDDQFSTQETIRSINEEIKHKLGKGEWENTSGKKDKGQGWREPFKEFLFNLPIFHSGKDILKKILPMPINTIIIFVTEHHQYSQWQLKEEYECCYLKRKRKKQFTKYNIFKTRKVFFLIL